MLDHIELGSISGPVGSSMVPIRSHISSYKWDVFQRNQTMLVDQVLFGCSLLFLLYLSSSLYNKYSFPYKLFAYSSINILSSLEVSSPI